MYQNASFWGDSWEILEIATNKSMARVTLLTSLIDSKYSALA